MGTADITFLTASSTTGEVDRVTILDLAEDLVLALPPAPSLADLRDPTAEVVDDFAFFEARGMNTRIDKSGQNDIFVNKLYCIYI